MQEKLENNYKEDDCLEFLLKHSGLYYSHWRVDVAEIVSNTNHSRAELQKLCDQLNRNVVNLNAKVVEVSNKWQIVVSQEALKAAMATQETALRTKLEEIFSEASDEENEVKARLAKFFEYSYSQMGPNLSSFYKDIVSDQMTKELLEKVNEFFAFVKQCVYLPQITLPETFLEQAGTSDLKVNTQSFSLELEKKKSKAKAGEHYFTKSVIDNSEELVHGYFYQPVDSEYKTYIPRPSA